MLFAGASRQCRGSRPDADNEPTSSASLRCQTGSPAILDRVEQPFSLVRGNAARIVLGPSQPSIGVQEDKRGSAVGVCCREQQIECPCLRCSEKCGALRASCVHHGAQIVHPFFQRGQLVEWDRVGETCAPFVEQNAAAKGWETMKKRGKTWFFPQMLDMGNPSVDKDEIDRSVACDLVGGMKVAAPRVPRFGNHHTFDEYRGMLQLTLARPRGHQKHEAQAPCRLRNPRRGIPTTPW